MTDERRRLYGVWIGEVTRRDDPEGRGGVLFRIPGLIEDESADWAREIGVSGGGHAQSGGPFHPPPIGANIAIFFEQGDPDKPVYLSGPWGAPDGVSDAPTGSAVEGDDRQNAVTEDQEWLIERDSRTSAPLYRVQHKSSGAEIVIHGSGRLELVTEGATQALVLGTGYRAEEATYLTDLNTALGAVETALKAFKADAGFLAAFGALAGTLESLGLVLGAALGTLGARDMAADGTAHLSTDAFTE